MKDKEKQRQFQRDWVAKRRSDFFADKHCAKCGATENLQLSRLKSGPSLRGIWSWSAERRAEVLKQCQLLCEQHFKEDYAVKRSACVKHGTEWMYMKYRCRCEACVQAASAARQKRRGR